MAKLISRHPDVWAEMSGYQVKETSKFKNRQRLLKSLESCETRKKRVLLEKKPRNVHSIDSIRSQFPGARIFMMVRDPHQVIPSLMKRGSNFQKALGRYINDNAPIIARVNHTFNVVVRYEDLVASPKELMRSVFRFASLRAEENVCEQVLQEGNHQAEAPRKGRAHTKLRNWEMTQPVRRNLSDSASRFGLKLDHKTVSSLECSTQNYINAFNYSFKTRIDNCST